MRSKAHTRVESGTCNVCSTPCSSCMHRKLACMGSKGDEYSDETCHVAEISQNSVNREDSLFLKGRKSSMLQHATSEASYVPTVDSCGDSFSESVENKANVRASVKPEACPSLKRVGTVSKGCLSPKPEFVAYKRNGSSKPVDSKAVEGHGDNISCVTEADVSSLQDGGRKVPFQNNTLLPNGNVGNLNGDLIGRVDGQASALFMERTSLCLPKEAAPDILGGGNTTVSDGAANNPQSRIVTQGDASEVSSKLGQEFKEETDNDGGRQPIGVNSSTTVGQDQKVDDSVELPNVQESPVESNESEDSEIGELDVRDVKVCDICGDAGQEEKLAICSRCSDGAEHTYCMKEMLLEVPDGDWLCEECNLAVELEKQKQDSEEKNVDKGTSQSFKKRPSETAEMTSSSKRQAIDMGSGSPKPSSPKRVATLHYNSSSRSLDKEKVKPSNHSINDPESSALLKSNSFSTNSSKPKVKLVDEVQQKHKMCRESSLLDSKDGPGRMMSKSMSFKHTGSGRTESKVKMLSSKIAHGPDVKGVRQAREHNAFERRNLPKLDRPSRGMVASSSKVTTPKLEQKLTPRSDSVPLSSAVNNRELKGAATDGKFSSLPRSSAGVARKDGDAPVTSVRASSIHGISIERKLNQVSPKDEPSPSTSLTADKSLNAVDDNSHDGLLCSRESSSQSEKTRDSSGRMRPAGATPKETGTCQKCKEAGHSVENCTSSSPRAPISDTPATKSVGDETNRDSKLKAAIEAAMRKRPGIYRKKHGSDQSDGLSSSNADMNCHLSPQAKFSGSNKTKLATFNERSHEEKPTLGPLSKDSTKQANYGSAKISNTHSATAAFPLRADSDLTNSYTWRSGLISSASALEKLSPIPEHDFIWQGTFEVHRGGKITNIHGGIQAHLSTYASPKVLEVVNKFPLNISLDEVSRSSTWPSQFHENGATENNIALYFFAKDLESYKKHYKGLLDNAMKRDLAFKGYFDDVELLIFPSTQLPEDSQRWNMMFFLWGVFKGRRSSSYDCLRKPVIPSLNLVVQDEEMPASNALSVARCLPEYIDNETSAFDDCCNMDVSSSDLEKNTCLSENGVINERKVDFAVKSEQPDCRLDLNGTTCSTTSNLESTSASATLVDIGDPECRVDTDEGKPSAVVAESTSCYKQEAHKHTDSSDVQDDVSALKNVLVENQNLGVRGSIVQEPAVSRTDSVNRGGFTVIRDLNEDITDMDIETSEGDFLSNIRKRPLLDLSEMPPPESPDSTVGQDMPWNVVHTGLADRAKKPKLSDEGPNGYDSSRDCNSKRDVNTSKAAAERYFFPVDSHTILWKGGSSASRREDQSSSPNLDLALGGETKPPGIMPFIVGMVAKNTTDKNKLLPSPPAVEKVLEDKEQEDGVSASLSLSLSFPFQDKEQTVKPPVIPKTEQLLPERAPCEYLAAPFWTLR
ncbi:unnamed protein product [Linum tenue]|uniref:PHD-type domain-containing protein n=1 Tax=Linum tenue TaxID=586396 RepID=A0AAV0RUW7_9ROSI|nr:unnamed protein product [Linum tenue]